MLLYLESLLPLMSTERFAIRDVKDFYYVTLYPSVKTIITVGINILYFHDLFWHYLYILHRMIIIHIHQLSLNDLQETLWSLKRKIPVWKNIPNNFDEMLQKTMSKYSKRL